MRDREPPAVATRLLGGGQHQTDAAHVDERQLVEVQDDVRAALAQNGQTLRDRSARGDVKLAAKLDTRPQILTRLDNLQQWLLAVQLRLLAGAVTQSDEAATRTMAVTSRGAERKRSTDETTPMPGKCK